MCSVPIKQFSNQIVYQRNNQFHSDEIFAISNKIKYYNQHELTVV